MFEEVLSAIVDINSSDLPVVPSLETSTVIQDFPLHHTITSSPSSLSSHHGLLTHEEDFRASREGVSPSDLVQAERNARALCLLAVRRPHVRNKRI